jgi:hypothetical protein
MKENIADQSTDTFKSLIEGLPEFRHLQAELDGAFEHIERQARSIGHWRAVALASFALFAGACIMGLSVAAGHSLR